ncbi:MAG: hypothetical protein KJO98_05830, partial [Rhodothermia bacterium]|nr:hypothetical protein [Rhodothermia bacterium]
MKSGTSTFDFRRTEVPAGGRRVAVLYGVILSVCGTLFFAGSAAEPSRFEESAWYFARTDTDSVVVNSSGLQAIRERESEARPLRSLARADTDSVRVTADEDVLRRDLRYRRDSLDVRAPDSSHVDSLSARPSSADSLGLRGVAAADTTDSTADTLRVLPFAPRLKRDSRSASLFGRSRRPLRPRISSNWKHQVELDTTSGRYIARESVAGGDVREPLSLDRQRYRDRRLKKGLNQNWTDLVAVRERQRQQRRRGGLGFNIVVPGGRQSAFTTIFGKPEVDLRVNGQADIRAGFDYRKSDQQVSVTGKAAQLDPDFKQDLRLGITGSIGDKMRVDVNYDTNNQFDFQNQLKLQYT